MSQTENGKFCLHCSKPLVGRQTRFCSDAHRQRYARQRARKRSGDRTTETTEHTTGNAIELFETVKRDLARSEGMIATLSTERDALRSERDTLSNRVNELERENGILEGRISAEPQPQPRRFDASMVVLIVIALAAVALVVVAVTQL